MRFVRPTVAQHCAGCAPFAPECPGVVPATACLGHRCQEHADLPLLNQAGPELAECVGCAGQAFVEAYEEAFEKRVFWPMVESARSKLDLLAPGSGDRFVNEARALLNAASQDDG